MTSSPDRKRVTGVLARSHDGTTQQLLESDLVVDASGRGSRTPVFLEDLGYGRPVEDHIPVRLAYSSQLVRIPAGMLDETAVIIAPIAGRPTGMALFANENSTWMWTLIGMVGHEPPVERTEMVQYANSFAPAHVLDALRAAEPLAEVTRHRMPSSQWRRYDKMRGFPAGLLVVGDAVCSFNPIYGQGMTVAAVEAATLAACLRGGQDGLARRYFRASAKAVDRAWQLSAGGDLNLPEVDAPRPVSVRIANRYVDWLLAASESDVVVGERFSRVAALLDPPSSLMTPTVLLHAAKANRRRRRHGTAPSSRSRSSSAVDRYDPDHDSIPDDPSSPETLVP
jgi:2-polyprenyl-6-methoxyphenol hydroxylase-like FAD-dependent oxidoreductase